MKQNKFFIAIPFNFKSAWNQFVLPVLANILTWHQDDESETSQFMGRKENSNCI